MRRWAATLVIAGACTADDGSGASAGSTSGADSTGTLAVSASDGPADSSDDATGVDTTSGTETTDGTSDGTDDSSGGGDTSCAVVDIEGDCDDVAACPEGSTAFGAICGGPPSQQCCVPVAPPCSVDGAPGLCTDVADCAFTTTPGLCPGDATVQCCTDPATACDPSAMPTPNEGLVEARLDPQCPPGMVRGDGFCIDAYEASLVELDAGGSVVGSWSPFFNPGDVRVRAVSIEGAVAQGYIDQVRAAEACAEAGKRLCTDAEWLAACQGVPATTYPYGDALEPGRCNDARATHPAIEYFGTADPSVFSMLGHPCISQIPASLDLTGQNAGCESAVGAFDMMGNLHEWTSDPAGTFRGGFYVDTMINGPGCTYVTTAHDVSHWDYSTGFRCCAD